MIKSRRVYFIPAETSQANVIRGRMRNAIIRTTADRRCHNDDERMTKFSALVARRPVRGLEQTGKSSISATATHHPAIRRRFGTTTPCSMNRDNTAVNTTITPTTSFFSPRLRGCLCHDLSPRWTRELPALPNDSAERNHRPTLISQLSSPSQTHN